MFSILGTLARAVAIHPPHRSCFVLLGLQVNQREENAQ